MGCLLFAVTGTAAHAQSFTIINGQTETTQQTVGTGGTGLIEALGALNVAAADALVSAGNSVTVNNAGTITAPGGGFDGIRARHL